MCGDCMCTTMSAGARSPAGLLDWQCRPIHMRRKKGWSSKAGGFVGLRMSADANEAENMELRHKKQPLTASRPASTARQVCCIHRAEEPNARAQQHAREHKWTHTPKKQCCSAYGIIISLGRKKKAVE